MKFILAFVIALSPAAFSAVLFDNFVNDATGFQRVDYQSDRAAIAFLTGDSPVILNTVTIELFSSSSQARELRLHILSNNETTSQPAATVGEFDQLIQVPVGDQNANLAYASPFSASDPGIYLDANTVFWLAVSGAGNYGNGDGGIFWTLPDNSDYQEFSGGVSRAPGMPSYFSNDAGGTWPHDHNWTYVAAFEGIIVPEPESLVLVGSGLILALRRRR